MKLKLEVKNEFWPKLEGVIYILALKYITYTVMLGEVLSQTFQLLKKKKKFIG